MTDTTELLDEETERLMWDAVQTRTANVIPALRSRIRFLVSQETERCAKIAEKLNSALIPDAIRKDT